jgi:hypothetical protein
MSVRGVLSSLSAFCLMFSGMSRAQSPAQSVKYTAPPAMASLNSQASGSSSYYGQGGLGAFHVLVAKIFDGSGVAYQYAPSDSYNMAVQNVMLYDRAAYPNDKIDFAIGVAFDEDNLKYLDYVPVPVYADFLSMVVDSAVIGAGFKPAREMDAAAAELMGVASPVALTRLRLDIADALSSARVERMGDAIEAVLTDRRFLIAPWSFVENYLALGASNPKIKSLQILKYRKRKVMYFVALSRKAAARGMMFGPSPMTLGEFMAARLAELSSSGALGEIFAAAGK